MTLKLRGEKSQLTDDREAKLNAIAFRWVAPGFQKKSIKDWTPNEYYTTAVSMPAAKPAPETEQAETVPESTTVQFLFKCGKGDNLCGRSIHR